MPDTPLLDSLNGPEALRALEPSLLAQVADELRAETIDAVSVTGGHLGAGLGVVELTVALHYVFATPRDRLIWDVGHQCYPHKILTGRRDRIRTLRQAGGLSGFTKRAESAYDPFGAAHSSTSISAGLGMATAAKLDGIDRHVISVIGDGAMSAGMAWEAMNNAGGQRAKMIVVLNDNNMSIAPPVGAMSNYLSQALTSEGYRSLRHVARKVASRLSSTLAHAAERAEEIARGVATGRTLFDELGFYYVGPVDGHDVETLVKILENLRDDPGGGPFLLHAVTRKGAGYPPAENAADKYHGVSAFDVATGEQSKKRPNAPSYTSVFASALCAEAERDHKIVAITAAMPSGTGVDRFAKRFPDRAFDVGIAEQHGVTFAAGLAADGYRPFVCIYSTFLQRGYDQVVHDVAIQGLPVRFVLDRAGLVGADGPTHAGAFDIGYLGALPGMVLMAAADEAELCKMIATQARLDDGPSAVRFPRGEGEGVDWNAPAEPLELGKGRIVQSGEGVALLSYGCRLAACLEAAEILAAETGQRPTVADARFAKPLDGALIAELFENHDAVLTVEAGAIGGFGSFVQQHALERGLLDRRVRLRSMTLPDRFVDHGSPAGMYREAGLDGPAIAAKARAIALPLVE